MYTATLLFSLLITMINAAPLPMPAAKMSDKLALRFYSSESAVLQHVPCWGNGYHGIIQDDICVLAALDIGSDGYAHRVPVGFLPVPGTGCVLNGVQGVWQGTTCILANVDINVKRNLLGLLTNEPCNINNRPGVWRNGLCNLLDADLAIDTLDTGYQAGTIIPAPFAGEPCWSNGQRGFWQNDLCVLADLDIAKRNIAGGHNGLVGGIVPSLNGDRYAKYNRPSHAIGSDIISADAEALIDVDHVYARNGLLDNLPSHNILGDSTKPISHLLEHVVKRDLLGLSPLNPSQHGNNDLIGQIEATVNLDVDSDDEPYYGHKHDSIIPIPLAKKDLHSSSINHAHSGQAAPHKDIITDVTASLGVHTDDHLLKHQSGSLGHILKRDLAVNGPTKNLLGLGSLTGTSTGNGLPVIGGAIKSVNTGKQGGLAGIL